ncbi:hypothetical protein ONE63_007488 [Megalurothrips usitatus]|uniref:WW domain binding protein VOPP1 n=1 Tax=Megalurothrips usitatus TaxID=439358 RepID=A0AAV7XQC1_9NEOP|nr:hypothetical protein ONE63_007488 [Megalurothrips usitatus]
MFITVRSLFLLQATSKTCDNGYRCHPPQDCCVQGCCAGAHTLHTPILPSGGGYVPTNVLSTVFWNHWFFWYGGLRRSLLALLLLSCSGGCSLWRRRHELDLLGCQGCAPGEDQDAQSDRDSTASCYPPPQYSRCNSFSQPPPYSEVTSKPDLYPLVISYNDNTANKGGSYLMVQYLRHYFLRPAGGSLSHASTAESLSSAFVCAVAPPEALAGAPPRYVSVADGSQATALPPAPPPLPPPGAAAAAAAVGHRPLPSSASLPSVCSLSSSRLSSRSGSRACSRTCSSRTGSRSRAQSYAHSMAVGEWSSSGSVSVSVQALQGGRGQAQPLLPPRHRGCSSTASEVREKRAGCSCGRLK